MVKYSIQMQGHTINNLEDLRKYFQVYEMLPLVDSGRLQIWLHHNGYDEYVEKLKTWVIVAKDKKKSKLYDLFDIPYDEATEYNITDRLLADARKNQLRAFNESNVMVFSQKDLDNYLNFLREYREDLEPEDIEVETIFLSNRMYGDYVIPYDLNDVVYVGFCEHSAFMPSVWLKRNPEEYDKRNINFENIRVHYRKSVIEVDVDDDALEVFRMIDKRFVKKG